MPLIRDAMSSHNLVTARPEDPLGLAAQMMLWAGVRHLPVVREGAVVGVLSERDILRRNGAVGVRVAAQEPVESAMTRPPITIGFDEPLVNGLTLMVSRKIGCLPVVSRLGLIGLITTTDILRHDLESALERPASRLPPPLRAIMKRVTAVTPDTELFDAMALMSARCIRHLPVLDLESKVIGIVSDRDVRAAIGDPRRFLDNPDARETTERLRVADVMSKNVVAVNQDAPLTTAVEHFVRDGIGALPIVDERRHLVGIVSYVDVIQALR